MTVSFLLIVSMVSCLWFLTGGVWSQVHLPIKAPTANTLLFTSLGDWGKVNSDQKGVANAMKSILGQEQGQFNATFLLAVGDNFYEDGVVSDKDPQWTDTYRNIYDAPVFDIDWYAIAGNHDHHYGRGQGEIDYYKNRRDNRWTYPAWWYTQRFYLYETNVSVELVFIDTVLLSGDGNVTWPKERNEQYQWIEKTLQDSSSDWLIVVGHYPVFSGGEHGDTDDLVQHLLPMLLKYNVDMYLCGHDHTMQHLQNTQNAKTSTQYFVSGNGAKRGTFNPTKNSVFGRVDPGFMLHSIQGLTTMHTAVVDLDGTTIYQYSQNRIPKRHDVSRITNNARLLHDKLTIQIA